MPEPQTTISVFQSFLDADRAKTLLASNGISAFLVEEERNSATGVRDVVHLLVAESVASQALSILVAAGQVIMPDDADPDFGPPAEGEPSFRCPRCGRSFSTEYDFCPRCDPPPDWLASAVARPRSAANGSPGSMRLVRPPPPYSQRDDLAKYALYAALLGLCVPIGGSVATLVLVVLVAVRQEPMRRESWMCVYVACIIAAAELGVAGLVWYSLLAG